MTTPTNLLFAQVPGLSSAFDDIFKSPSTTSTALCNPTVNPSVSQIIREAATRMEGVSVDIDRCMAFVSISSDGREPITFQGHEADAFIDAVDKLYNDAGDVTEDDAALCHAASYAESIWG